MKTVIMTRVIQQLAIVLHVYVHGILESLVLRFRFEWVCCRYTSCSACPLQLVQLN